MAIPLIQKAYVGAYVLRQQLARRKRYPLVLMLEPLFRCNLACAGCGKIQYPAQILRKHLTVEQCLAAVDECDPPVVSIPGGEPLMYPEIGPLVKALVARKKYVYLCTNAILLKQKLEAGLFEPSNYFSFSVHLDGLRAEHDEAVCRDGVYVDAVEGIKEALRRGFRVTTNSTLFDGADALRMREFFDTMMDLGVEGMMIAGLQLLEGARPGAFPSHPARPRPLLHAPVEPEAPVEVQPVAAVPAVSDGQAGLRVHAVGQPHLQRLRLAAPLLPDAGRLCRELQGAAGDHALGELRPEQRQREVPRLHGALWVRALGRAPHVRLVARLPRHRAGHRHRAVLIPGATT